MSERRRMLLAIVNQFKWLPYSYEYLYHSLIPNELPTFNIWDEEYKIGLIQYDKTQSNFGRDISGNNLVCKNYISVKPNTNYYFQGATPQKSGIVFCYDKDYNPIIVDSSGYIAISSVNIFTTPSNCAYIRFYMASPYGQTYNSDICINISSSLNGTYKPYSPKSVKNKAKFTKIYGNSEVVNEVIDRRKNTSSTSLGVSISYDDKGDITLNNTSTAVANFALASSINIIDGHKYLLVLFISDSTNVSITYNPNGFYTKTHIILTGTSGTALSGTISSNSTNYPILRIESGATLNNVKISYSLIDLTKQYPFDTPTTLTDNRVKNILAQGYIPYNLGEIKDMEIGEFSSEDSNNQPLGTLQLPALYKSSGIGTSKDSWEITDSGYVFTKNVGSVDLGSLSYQYKSDNPSNLRFISTTLSTMDKLAKPTQPDLLCKKYISVSGYYFDNNGTVDKIIRIDDDLGRFVIRDLAYTDGTTFKSALSGIYAYYPLATPQVITIPRKHLAVVRIRDLSWASQTAYGTKEFYNNTLMSVISKPNANDQIANIYCSNFMTTYRSNGTANSGIAVGTNGLIVIKCTDSDTDFLNKYGEYSIFYETENEVPDITDTFDIEAGGSVNGNLFSWVRNQLVNKSTLNASASNISVDTSTGKVELDLSTFVRYANTFTLSNGNEYIIDLVQGHKYLLRGFKTTSTPASDNSWWIQVRNNSAGVSGRLYSENEIFTANNGGLSAIFIYVLNNYTANDKIVGYPQLIDLNVAFPNGDIPTDINDYRIQYILEHGYIPTDINGTYTNECCEVLPDVDFKLKCK